jgi:hypothetical protein
MGKLLHLLNLNNGTDPMLCAYTALVLMQCFATRKAAFNFRLMLSGCSNASASSRCRCEAVNLLPTGE